MFRPSSPSPNGPTEADEAILVVIALRDGRYTLLRGGEPYAINEIAGMIHEVDGVETEATQEGGGLVETFLRDGFVVVENFFDSRLMDELDGLIRDHFGDNPDYRHNDEFLQAAQTEVVPWFPQNDGVQAFDVIDEDPGLHELTRAILGEGWVNHYCMVMFSRKGTTGQAWHQDCPPEDASLFNLNRLVYTSDINDEIGGQTVIVRGSYRRGLLPAGDPLGEFEDQVVLSPTKGTLVLLHGHTWHRVLPISGACRYSVNYRAGPAGSTGDLTDVCVYRNMRYRFSTSRIIEERIDVRVGCEHI